MSVGLSSERTKISERFPELRRESTHRAADGEDCLCDQNDVFVVEQVGGLEEVDVWDPVQGARPLEPAQRERKVRLSSVRLGVVRRSSSEKRYVIELCHVRSRCDRRALRTLSTFVFLEKRNRGAAAARRRIARARFTQRCNANARRATVARAVVLVRRSPVARRSLGALWAAIVGLLFRLLAKGSHFDVFRSVLRAQRC